MEVREVLPRDAIPSVDDPRFEDAYFGEPEDRVVVVEGDPARAYPIRILSYHEIVNDCVDGEPVAVTWCPICGSALVFDRAVGDRTLTFGVSGKLADDALVMYDRETGSEWKQPLGEAIAGPLAGETLEVRPAPITTWARFRDDHSDGLTLQPARADARRGSPGGVYDMGRYGRYFDGEEFGLYGMRGEGARRTWERDDLDAKTVVLGIESGDDATAYPMPWIESAGGVVTDAVGGLDVVVFAADGEPYAYGDPGFEYEPTNGGFGADGAIWDPVTGASDDGRRLARVPGRRLFAFAWQDAHGPDAFYSPA